MVVSDGRTNAHRTGSTHSAGECDVPGVIVRRDGGVLRFHRSVANVRLRGVIEEVHGHGGVKGNGLRLAAGGGERQISCHCVRRHVHVLRRSDRRAAVDVSFGGVGLVHAKHSAA